MTSLTALLIFAAIIWFWLDSARAREIATAACSDACKQRNLQFLDQTVSLRRIGVRWTSQGIRLRRLFRFDYSEEGTMRSTGHIILIGIQLEDFSYGLVDSTGHGAPTDKKSGKVIPLKRKPPET